MPYNGQNEVGTLAINGWVVDMETKDWVLGTNLPVM